MPIFLIHKDYKFIYPTASHVVTGNFKMNSDSIILNIVFKRAKYRFPPISISTGAGKKLHLH